MVKSRRFRAELPRLMLLFLAAARCSADLTVRVTSSHVVAIRGHSVVLGCEYSPDLSPSYELANLVISWQRKEVPNLVHSFYAEQDHLENQDPTYRGRTKLFPSELAKGNVSLILERVGLSDEGVYQCIVNTNTGTNQAELRLDSGVLYAVPRLSISVGSSETSLQYEAEGFPAPEVKWIGHDGGDISQHAQTSILKDQKSGLYHLKSSSVVPNRELNFTFVLKNDLLQQHLRMPVSYKGGCPSCKTEIIALSVISTLLAVAVGILAWCLYRKNYRG